MVRTVNRAKLYHHAKFRADWSNRCGDMTFFDFQNGGHRHLYWQHCGQRKPAGI